MRITILGLPGSGKTTLAKKISSRLDIPHIHIDHFWFEGGGRHNSKSTANPEAAHAHVKQRVSEAIQSESWVSDGVYRLVQPDIAAKANVLLFLDIPLYRRMLNHAKRTIYRKDRSAEMNFLADMGFFLEMIRRDLRKKGKIRELVEEYRAKAVILRSRKEISDYVESLAP